MKCNNEIHKLWKYLRIQDNEVLIIRFSKPSDGTDEYIVVKKEGNGLDISTSDTWPEAEIGDMWHKISQKDSNGRYVIPSVDDMIAEEEADY